MSSSLSFSGDLQVKKIGRFNPAVWRLKNYLRPGFILGLLVTLLARLFSKLTGVLTITSELRLTLIRADGEVQDLGVASRRMVTDAGVAFLVDDWDAGSTDITNFNYHGAGTGTAAEAAGDTALVTEVESRATGTKSQPAANQFRTIGTVSFTGTRAITEHGLFSAASAGSLWDRSVYAAVNVVSGESIQFTYTCTLNSGG